MREIRLLMPNGKIKVYRARRPQRAVEMAKNDFNDCNMVIFENTEIGFYRDGVSVAIGTISTDT